MLQTKNNQMFRVKQVLISLFMTLVLGLLSSGFAQVSIVEQLTDFVKNTNIEFLINNQRVGQQIPVYAENQDVGFSVLSQVSGYHYLYVVSGDGSSSLIYPNEFENQAYIQADTQTNFPSNTAYRLIAQNGQGTDFHIVSIVSPTPLTGFTIGFTNGFNIVPPATQVIPGYQASAMRYRVQASNQTAVNCASNCLYLSPAPALVQPPVYTPTTPAATNTATSSTPGQFQGFATYQDYLDNYYSQNATTQAPATTPVVTPTPSYTYTTPSTTYTAPATTVASNYSVPNYAATNSTAGTFQGFASYQAYLDNYYAQNGGQANSTNTQTTATINQTVATSTSNIATPVTVYTSLVGGGATTATTPTNSVVTNSVATNTGGYQGFASYQDYLDNFYSQSASFTNAVTAQVQQPVATDPFQGFGSYEAYLANYQATVGNTIANTAGTATNTNNYSVYNVVPTQTTQAPNYAVNYAISQQQLQQNNGVSYTQLSPYTQPTTNTVTTVNTDYSQSGFFDFEVGTSYTLFQSLGIRVLSIQDNRCPAGVQCVQAGNLSATVEIQFANVQRSFTITMIPGDEPTIGIGNTSLRFIGLSDVSSTALRVYVVTQ